MILQVLIATVAGWINRHQQQVIAFLQEENRVLKSKLPAGRLRLSDTERRRLAALASYSQKTHIPPDLVVKT
jgi:hypothetical protein